jgi:hypothetical protein
LPAGVAASCEEPHDDFADVQWSDVLPRLVQTRLLHRQELRCQELRWHRARFRLRN